MEKFDSLSGKIPIKPLDISDRNNIPHSKVSPEITIAITFTIQTSIVNVIIN